MTLRILILATLLATPATAQTLPTDPATVMARVLAVFAGIDLPPAEVMTAFLPEAGSQDSIVGPIPDLPAEVNDPHAVQFTVILPGTDPLGGDGATLTCIRFGPPTLAFAARDDAPAFGPMLMKRPAEGWIGTVAEDLPELGSPQTFPEGAILRQDCAVQFGVAADMDIEALKDWPAAALTAIEGQFGTLTATDISGAPNSRVAVRASDPQGDGAVQIRLMMGVMPYRPFDDVTLPAFGLELQAVTYLFATPG